MSGEKPKSLEELFGGGPLNPERIRRIANKTKDWDNSRKKGKGKKGTKKVSPKSKDPRSKSSEEKQPRPKEGRKIEKREVKRDKEWVASFRMQKFTPGSGTKEGEEIDQWVAEFHPQGKTLKCVVHPNNTIEIEPGKRYVFKPWRTDKEGEPIYKEGDKNSDYRLMHVRIVGEYEAGDAKDRVLEKKENEGKMKGEGKFERGKFSYKRSNKTMEGEGMITEIMQDEGERKVKIIFFVKNREEQPKEGLEYTFEAESYLDDGRPRYFYTEKDENGRITEKIIAVKLTEPYPEEHKDSKGGKEEEKVTIKEAKEKVEKGTWGYQSFNKEKHPTSDEEVWMTKVTIGEKGELILYIDTNDPNQPASHEEKYYFSPKKGAKPVKIDDNQSIVEAELRFPIEGRPDRGSKIKEIKRRLSFDEKSFINRLFQESDKNRKKAAGEIEMLTFENKEKIKEIEYFGQTIKRIIESGWMDVKRADNLLKFIKLKDNVSAIISIDILIKENKDNDEQVEALENLKNAINNIFQKEEIHEEEIEEVDQEERRERTPIEEIADILRESEYVKGNEVAKRAVISRIEMLLRDRKYEKALLIIDNNFNISDDKIIDEKIENLAEENPVLNKEEQKPEAITYGSRESEDISPMEKSRKIAARSIEKMASILDLELKEGNIRKALLALNKNYPFTALRFLEIEEERLSDGVMKDRFGKTLREGEGFDDGVSIEQKLTHFKAFVETEYKDQQENLEEISIQKLSMRLNSLMNDFMEDDISDKKELMDDIREFNSTTNSNTIKDLKTQIFDPIREARDPYAGQVNQEDEAYRDMNNIFNKMIEKQQRREGNL